MNWITEITSFLFGVFMSLAIIYLLELRKLHRKTIKQAKTYPYREGTAVFDRRAKIWRPYNSIQEFIETMHNLNQEPKVGFCFYLNNNEPTIVTDYVMIYHVDINKNGSYTILVKKTES